jgi:hypothetical protein
MAMYEFDADITFSVSMKFFSPSKERAETIATRVASNLSNLPVITYDEETDTCFPRHTFGIPVTPGRYIPQIEVILVKEEAN